MLKLKEVFETNKGKVDPNSEVENRGEAFKLAIKRPTPKQESDASAFYAKQYFSYYDAGARTRKKVQRMMLEDGTWGPEQDSKLEGVDKSIDDNLAKLKAGGISLLEARQAAIDVRKGRIERLILSSERNALDNLTCDAKAQEDQFNYLVAVCTVNPDTDKPYFKSYEDFLNRQDEYASLDARSKAGFFFYGIDEDYQKKFPENKFLVDYGFADKDSLHLIDKDGNKCDEDFNPVEEDAPSDDVKFTPFLDNSGDFVAVPGV